MPTPTAKPPTARASSRWQPGQSGNPRGRPRGSGPAAKLRQSIAEHAPAIINSLLGAALAGDVGAARALLDRCVPPLRAAELPAPVPLAGTLTESARSILAAVSAGDLAPGQAAQLLAAVAATVRVIEADELTRRIELLEAARGTT